MKIAPMLCAVSAMAAALAGSPASAQDAKPTLTVYTYSSFSGEYGPGAAIKERFEASCGCVLEWVATDDGATLLARLKLEGASTRADVVLGLDTSLMAEAEATGLFQPHGLDLGGLALPIEWTSDIFVPFDWSWFAFVYDKTKLPDPPSSFEELIEAGENLSIVVQDPRTSTPGLGLLLWIRTLYGEEADAVWRKLAPKIVTVTKGWSEAYGLFQRGEADMVLSYTTSPAYHIAEENTDRYAAAIFPEGHYAQVEIAGLTRSSDEPELGRSFLEFMISDGFQSAIPQGNWMYPAKPAADGLPESFAGLPKPEKTLLMPPEAVAEGRSAWISDWLEAMAR